MSDHDQDRMCDCGHTKRWHITLVPTGEPACRVTDGAGEFCCGCSLFFPADPEPPTKVPDLPCPKCGSEDVRMGYVSGRLNYCSVDSECWKSRRNTEEHFHRTCQRCHHQWSTYDVLGA